MPAPLSSSFSSLMLCQQAGARAVAGGEPVVGHEEDAPAIRRGGLELGPGVTYRRVRPRSTRAVVCAVFAQVDLAGVGVLFFAGPLPVRDGGEVGAPSVARELVQVGEEFTRMGVDALPWPACRRGAPRPPRGGSFPALARQAAGEEPTFHSYSEVWGAGSPFGPRAAGSRCCRPRRGRSSSRRRARRRGRWGLRVTCPGSRAGRWRPACIRPGPSTCRGCRSLLRVTPALRRGAPWAAAVRLLRGRRASPGGSRGATAERRRQRLEFARVLAGAVEAAETVAGFQRIGAPGGARGGAASRRRGRRGRPLRCRGSPPSASTRTPPPSSAAWKEASATNRSGTLTSCSFFSGGEASS